MVLDCSVTLSWCFPDESHPYALAVREVLSQSRAYVPSLWISEVANGLLVAERRGRVTAADTTQFARAFLSLPLVVEDVRPDGWLDDLITIGRAHNLSAYDAAYLELAMRLGVPIATLDDTLLQAATAVGVKTFEA